jgi:hypothetical protein
MVATNGARSHEAKYPEWCGQWRAFRKANNIFVSVTAITSVTEHFLLV